MAANPLDIGDLDREQRIRERAYHLWDRDGRPEGRELEYWEQARTLIGMSENPQAGQMSVVSKSDRPIEEAALQDNLGEFPGLQADQGEHLATPRAPRDSNG
jgi:hypothetical protein